MKKINSVEDLKKLSNGTKKEKLIALTYGYQPIIDKLKEDKDEEVSSYAYQVDKDEDMKLYKNDQAYETTKDKFLNEYRKYSYILYGMISTILISTILVIVSVVLFLQGTVNSVNTLLIISLVIAVISIGLNYILKRQEKVYLKTKVELKEKYYLFDISKSKVDMLQKDIENTIV